MYYLPINIDKRRIHICELSDDNDRNNRKPLFGFLFTSGTLFNTYDQGNNELIAEWGENVKLKNYHFEMFTESKWGQKVYVFQIVADGKGVAQDAGGKRVKHPVRDTNPEEFPFDVYKKCENFDTTGVEVNFKKNNQRPLLQESFIVCIRYVVKNINYEYYFNGHCTDTEHIVDAAIDFGSEASQIKSGAQNEPFEIIDTLKKYYSQYAQISSDDGFWQSDPQNPRLFKSNYFIHRHPAATYFAEKPNANGEKSFMQMLVPLTKDKGFYQDTVLLPNLKLLDLLPATQSKILSQQVSATADSFSTRPTGAKPEGQPDQDENQNYSLGSENFRGDILRLILSNFLYCIIDKGEKKKQEQFLHLFVLVPNVYRQDKVFRIIEDLYEDYQAIAQNKYKGIEVSVISESDASFLGVRTECEDVLFNVPDYKTGRILIVDSGKGTTDFSILQADKGNNAKWNSLYRDGLPAAGQALTYAFYEALYAFFLRQKKPINLDKMLRDNPDRSVLRGFVNVIEELKAHYASYQEVPDSSIAELSTIATLADVSKNIETHFVKNKRLPAGTHFYVERKIEEMNNILVDKIENRLSEMNTKAPFACVILTGRAFALEAFRTSLVALLKYRKLLAKRTKDANINIIYEQVKDPKKICLGGSMSARGGLVINNNSELICRPYIVGQANTRNKALSFLVDKINTIQAKVTSEAQFLYGGQKVLPGQTVSLRIGDLHAPIAEPDSIYYVGRNFLAKSGINKKEIKWYEQHEQNAKALKRLILESLFPYHDESIPKEGEHEVLYDPNKDAAQQQEKDTQQTATASQNDGKQEPETVQPPTPPVVPPAPDNGNGQKTESTDYARF